MTKRKLFLLILIFIFCDALVLLSSLLFLGDWGLPAWFALTVGGLTVLLVYVLVSRLSGATQTPAPASPEASAPAPSPGSGRSAAVSALIQEANEKLAKSPTLASQRVKSTITDFPLYFVLGAEGTGKTSLFLAAGFEPELLAGQVHRESAVVPTRLGNIWFAESAVVVEGAGDFFSGEDSRWKDFLASFHRPGGKSRFARIFGANAETKLSGVLLCCDAGAFVGVPDSARVAALGRMAQQRLQVVAEVFGRDVPVYVIFTKSDSIPYFGEYFGRLTESEDQQVLGCTFPAVAAAQSPTNEAITAGLNNLYFSLADRRLEFLEREKDSAKRPAIYEFPREFKRLRGPLGQFLLDVFRAKPLQPNPRLAGVYFTGTRRVVGRADDLDRSGVHKVGDVTRILRAEDLQKLRSQPPDSREREPEITRWSFVSDLWQQILHRRPAAAASSYITRRQLYYRKVAFVSAVAVFGLASLLFANSFLRNYSLVSQVQAAALRCEAVPQGTVPSARNLQEIDALRQRVEALVEDKPGILMHFGFYEGRTLLDPAWRVYYARLREYFLEAIVRRLEGELSGLPSEQNSSYRYDAVFDTLKTYRTITRSPSETSCTPDSALVDRLMVRWRQDRPLDVESERIARENFRFYATSLKSRQIPDELQILSKDDQVVQRGRNYLSAFNGAEPQYRQIIEQVNHERQSPTRLADLMPDAKYRSVLRVGEEVPAAFTRPGGWDRVQELIESAAGGSAGESCVLGSGGSRLASLPAVGGLKAQLRKLYIDDYIRYWSDYLTNTSVLPYGGCKDAEDKLGILKENNSPILAVLLLTAENTTFPKHAGSRVQQAGQAALQKAGTRFKSFFGQKQEGAGGQTAKALNGLLAGGPSEDQITDTFQPAHAVFKDSPPNREHWADERNTPYLNSLGDLQRALQALDRGGKCDETNQAANNQANVEMAKAQGVIDGLARNFNSKGVYEKVKALLESPLPRGLIIKDPAEVTRRKIISAQQQLCTGLGTLTNKYPFSLQGNDAGLDQVGKVFDPKDGLLAALRLALGDLVVKSDGNWSPKPDAPIQLSRSFLEFFNRMSEISAALFPQQGGAAAMKFKLSVQASPVIKQVIGTIDGGPISMSKEYSWPPSNGEINLRVEPTGGGSTPLCSYSGLWAIFRLLSSADHTVGTNLFPLVYLKAEGAGSLRQPILPDRSPIVFEVTQYPNGVRKAFDRGFFAVSCPSRIFE